MYLALLEFKISATNFLTFGANTPCPGGDFIGLPKWYKYLDSQSSTIDGQKVCSPQLTGLSDIWLIALALIEILLRIAILVAIIFVIIGGIKFITSRGENNPDKIGAARKTVVDALVGLVIAVIATGTVSFIATKVSGT